jgi:hypothetical protein
LLCQGKAGKCKSISLIAKKCEKGNKRENSIQNERRNNDKINKIQFYLGMNLKFLKINKKTCIIRSKNKNSKGVYYGH